MLCRTDFVGVHLCRSVPNTLWIHFFKTARRAMNKIEIKCYINGENELGSSSLYLSRTESWDQVLYKISLKVSKALGSNPRVYNEMGVEVTCIADLEDGDKIYFEPNGGPFVPPTTRMLFALALIS